MVKDAALRPGVGGITSRARQTAGDKWPDGIPTLVGTRHDDLRRGAKRKRGKGPIDVPSSSGGVGGERTNRNSVGRWITRRLLGR